MGWLAGQLELSRGLGGHNVRSMEGMRGFAVVLVFLVHFFTLAAPWVGTDPALQVITCAIRKIGNSGVDLFFVLSGYLIYGSLINRPQPFLPFMRRRVVRIYPAFLVVFAAYMYLSFRFPAESRIPLHVFDAGVYILQNLALLPGIFPIPPMITVAWSLSYEMFFYLAIPAMMVLLNLRKRSALWRVRFFLGLIAAIVGLCVAFGGPLRLIMFIIGMLLHEALRKGKIASPRFGLAPMALAAGLLLMASPYAFTEIGAVKLCILGAAFFIACYSCFRGQSPSLVRAFSWTPARWLGNMSYSYYLVHGLALKAAFAKLVLVAPKTGHGMVFIGMLMLAMFAITLIPSLFLFIIVERPFSLTAPPRLSRVERRLEPAISRVAIDI